jgi:hypothetical protein
MLFGNTLIRQRQIIGFCSANRQTITGQTEHTQRGASIIEQLHLRHD